ncbi:sigma-70 family RNA polymerase sigma factor [Streptomyces sp. SID6673]|nr:sigma-70 family RNA polymerase sigma factor [Streptomyces sp. SID11726]NEB23342.1 sigma-70 family RNA polymerase sigma factor [Streptomyces sp. SID6673]
MADTAGSAIARLAREESGRVLALLAARFDDVDLADDCVQDALLQAAETWPTRGVPDNPPAWLYTVARNRIVDQLRLRASRRRRLSAAAPELLAGNEPSTGPELIVDNRELGDERLRLLLLCCHPALDRDAQVALTLRLVGGLTTAEIAAAFLVSERALAQRIVRAKRKIRDARIPLTIPADIDSRVGVLLGVLYLIFNEGYLSRGATPSLVRLDLADEAIRLTGQLIELIPENGEAHGLLALEMFHRARFGARLDVVGDLVVLSEQDRSHWDATMIERARTVLQTAVACPGVGVYRIQAIIAALHAGAETAADTDWAAIVDLYRILERIDPGPVVVLNRAIAVSMVDGPEMGLAEVDAIDGLTDYHLWHAARGELLYRAGDPAAAAEAFGNALSLADNPVEQRHLRSRIDMCSAGEASGTQGPAQ